MRVELGYYTEVWGLLGIDLGTCFSLPESFKWQLLYFAPLNEDP